MNPNEELPYTENKLDLLNYDFLHKRNMLFGTVDYVISKIEELKNKTIDQLKSILIDLKKESFNLRFQKANGQLENTARVTVVKRSVARVLTLINNKIKNESEN